MPNDRKPMSVEEALALAAKSAHNKSVSDCSGCAVVDALRSLATQLTEAQEKFKREESDCNHYAAGCLGIEHPANCDPENETPCMRCCRDSLRAKLERVERAAEAARDNFLWKCSMGSSICNECGSPFEGNPDHRNDCVIGALDAALRDEPPAEPKVCRWMEEEPGLHVTACGNTFFVHEEGDPPNKWAKFCCYCGLALEAVAFVEDRDAPQPSAAGTLEEVVLRSTGGDGSLCGPIVCRAESVARAVAQRCAELCREKAAEAMLKFDTLTAMNMHQTALLAKAEAEAHEADAAAILAWQKEGK